MARAVITQLNSQPFLLVYEDAQLVECHPFIFQEETKLDNIIVEKTTLRIGNIYIGRVEKVVKNIQSAFIRLDNDNVGYLPLNDKPALVLNRKLPKGLLSIAEGDKVLVQVEQEPQKMKQARVTGNVSLTGNYLALDLSSGHIGVSKKIKDKIKIHELKTLISSEQVKNNDMLYGCILRTACENVSNETVLNEYRYLSELLSDIIKKAQFEKNTGLIYSEKKEWLSLLMDYGLERFKEIKTDISDIYEELKAVNVILGEKTQMSDTNTVIHCGEVTVDLILYKDNDYPLCKLLGLETEIKKILSKRVWLKSGGFLVIEPTEAMVVIDVNSGKSIGKKNKDNHILKINLEAAQEITKQLRLRNLSGIIMVDFINMSRNEDKQQVINCLVQGLKKDKVPGYFVDITKLDLFELTRKKIRKPFHEVISCHNRDEVMKITVDIC